MTSENSEMIREMQLCRDIIDARLHELLAEAG